MVFLSHLILVLRKWINDKKNNLLSTMLTSKKLFINDKNVGYFAALQTHSINPNFLADKNKI